jgi:hypothetical protein
VGADACTGSGVDAGDGDTGSRDVVDTDARSYSAVGGVVSGDRGSYACRDELAWRWDAPCEEGAAVRGVVAAGSGGLDAVVVDGILRVRDGLLWSFDLSAVLSCFEAAVDTRSAVITPSLSVTTRPAVDAPVPPSPTAGVRARSERVSCVDTLWPVGADSRSARNAPPLAATTEARPTPIRARSLWFIGVSGG